MELTALPTAPELLLLPLLVRAGGAVSGGYVAPRTCRIVPGTGPLAGRDGVHMVVVQGTIAAGAPGRAPTSAQAIPSPQGRRGTPHYDRTWQKLSLDLGVPLQLVPLERWKPCWTTIASGAVVPRQPQGGNMGGKRGICAKARPFPTEITINTPQRHNIRQDISAHDTSLERVSGH